MEFISLHKDCIDNTLKTASSNPNSHVFFLGCESKCYNKYMLYHKCTINKAKPKIKHFFGHQTYGLNTMCCFTT